MYIDRWMDKEIVVYIYNRILLRDKKDKIIPFATTWMDLESVTLTNRENRLVVTRG